MATTGSYNDLEDKPGFALEEFNFCDEQVGVKIPNSDGALFCALTFVDDDTANGSCEIFRSGNEWFYRTGGACAAQSCSGMCLMP